MRTIRIKAYKFDELSNEAKETAISNYRNSEHYDGFYYDEITESVKAVVDLFNLQTGNRYTDFRTGNIDDNILELKGARLLSYIWNNYGYKLFKGKYYSTPGKYIDGKYTYKSRYSKIFLDDCCVLTGVGYDSDILEPVYSFLKKPDLNTTFQDLIDSMEHAGVKCYDTAEDWLNGDEFISDMFENNDWEFTKEGKEVA